MKDVQDTMSPQERLFGAEARELLRKHGDEFIVSTEGVLFHSCGWMTKPEHPTAWVLRGCVLRHLRTDHQERT